jgi:hypothetical protein
MKRIPTLACCAVIAVGVCKTSEGVAEEPSATGATPTSPIATDRPGNGNAPTTVPQWRLQIETSVAYAFDRTDGGDGHLVNFPTALRFGVLEFLELRFGSGLIGIDAAPVMGADVASATDTFVGTKLQVLANDGWTPNLGVVVDVYLPSGCGGFTGDVVVPDGRVAASWALPVGLGLLFNAGADVPEDVDSRFARFIYVANVNYTPPSCLGACCR